MCHDGWPGTTLHTARVPTSGVPSLSRTAMSQSTEDLDVEVMQE